MKRKELQKCCICRQGMMHDHHITFYRIGFERFIVDLPAVQRLDGMEKMMGGGSTGAVLAGVMGTDEDIAIPAMKKKELFVCEDCATHTQIMYLLEAEPQPV